MDVFIVVFIFVPKVDVVDPGTDVFILIFVETGMDVVIIAVYVIVVVVTLEVELEIKVVEHLPHKNGQ